jgi:hypothetical protein
MKHIEDQIVFIDATWLDTFSLIVVTTGFSVGLLHLLILFTLKFHKYSMTRLLAGHGFCIFFVALCRLCMLLPDKFHNTWSHSVLIHWCYWWKALEIWSLGMANTCNTLMRLAYFRLIRKVWHSDLRLYHIGDDMAAWCIFVLLLLVCTVSTGFCMAYTGCFLLSKSYCIAIGSNKMENELHAL